MTTKADVNNFLDSLSLPCPVNNPRWKTQTGPNPNSTWHHHPYKENTSPSTNAASRQTKPLPNRLRTMPPPEAEVRSRRCDVWGPDSNDNPFSGPKNTHWSQTPSSTRARYVPRASRMPLNAPMEEVEHTPTILSPMQHDAKFIYNNVEMGDDDLQGQFRGSTSTFASETNWTSFWGQASRADWQSAQQPTHQSNGEDVFMESDEPNHVWHNYDSMFTSTESQDFQIEGDLLSFYEINTEATNPVFVQNFDMDQGATQFDIQNQGAPMPLHWQDHTTFDAYGCTQTPNITQNTEVDANLLTTSFYDTYVSASYNPHASVEVLPAVESADVPRQRCQDITFRWIENDTPNISPVNSNFSLPYYLLTAEVNWPLLLQISRKRWRWKLISEKTNGARYNPYPRTRRASSSIDETGESDSEESQNNTRYEPRPTKVHQQMWEQQSSDLGLTQELDQVYPRVNQVIQRTYSKRSQKYTPPLSGSNRLVSPLNRASLEQHEKYMRIIEPEQRWSQLSDWINTVEKQQVHAQLATFDSKQDKNQSWLSWSKSIIKAFYR